MLKFNAAAFVDRARKIQEMHIVIENNLAGASELDVPIPDAEVAPTMRYMEQLRTECEAVGLDSAADQLVRINHRIEERAKGRELVVLLHDLQNRIDDQLKRQHFYQLTQYQAQVFEAQFPFGQLVEQQFPSAIFDLHESAKCYACERYTASVYHLVKALEVVLRCLAHTLKVRYAPSWGLYLNRIDTSLKSKAARTSKRNKRLKFLSEAAILLRAVKEAWRDETMHVAGDYGPDQTAAILGSAQHLLNHLATGLSEKKRLPTAITLPKASGLPVPTA